MSLWITMYMNQLVGKKIIAAGTTVDNCPAFRLDNGWLIKVCRDEEDNGPGFLAGMPFPVMNELEEK